MISFDRKPRPATAHSPAPKHASQPAEAPPLNSLSFQLATSSTRTASEAVPASVPAALAGDGHPLDSGARARFEPGLGSLGDVRVHTDHNAAASARDVGALAYTVGRDIVFADRQFAPHSFEGEQLLAHELVHVAQQSKGSAGGSLAMGGRGDSHERNAEMVAGAMMRGEPSPPVHAAPALVQRQPKPPAQPAPSPAEQLYAQALPLVQTLDPTVFALLAKAPLGGGAKQVEQSVVTPQNPTDPPKTIAFNLEVVLDSTLPTNVDAQFDARATKMVQTPLTAGGTQYTFNPAILVNATVPPGATAQEMAETLVHEGTHLQIMMDPLLNTRSKHFSKFERYKQVADQQGAGIKRKIGFFIDMVLTRAKQTITLEQRAKDAAKVVSLLVEEKYVYDQDVSRIGKLRSNQRIASDYIVLGLDGVGIPRSAQQPAAELATLIQDATAFLDTMDAWVHNIPAPAFPPNIMPAPLPAAIK